jgi:hypothetical protein
MSILIHTLVSPPSTEYPIPSNVLEGLTDESGMTG